MPGIKSLDENAAGEFPTARAAGHLSEQLKSALGSAKIRQAERGVGADHADQGHALKIVPFGEHLRADENIQRAADKRSERFLVLALGSRGVAVQPRDAGARKFLAQACLQVLPALASKRDGSGPRLRPFSASRPVL